MRSFIVASAIATLVAPALAAADADVLGLPHCVKPCLDFSVVATSCDRDDLSCLCADPNFEYAINKCMFSQCQPHEYVNAFNYLKVVCPEGMTTLSMTDDESTLKKVLHARADSSSSSSASASASGSASGSSSSGAATATGGGAGTSPSAVPQSAAAQLSISKATLGGLVALVAVAGHAFVSSL